MATSVVLVASAAPGPRALKYACASNLYDLKKVLHYVSGPSKCKGSGKTLVRFASDYPVYVCRKEHGGFASAARAGRFPYPLGIRPHAPAGLIRLVDAPGKCALPTHPNETPVSLPATAARMFCAAKKGGELRWIQEAKGCDRKEFPVKVAKRTATARMVPAADSATTDEDSATKVDVLANDRGSDEVGQLDTTGTTGTVTVNSDNTTTYDPAGKFETLKPGQTATDTFTYTGKQGTRQSAAATVTVTITGVNDGPAAGDDSASTDENRSKRVAVLGNDTDVEGDALHPGSLDTAGTKGTPTVNGDGTISYDPNAKFESLQVGQSGTDSFKYKVTDGSADSGPATITLTIAGVNDAPVLSGIESATLNYLDGSAPAAISPGIAVGDVDNENVHSATVKVGSGLDPTHDALEFSDQNGITGSYASGTGVLALTGSATKDNYQTALRSVRFDSDGGSSGDRGLSFQIEDGQTADNHSDVATRTVTVEKAPVTDLNGTGTAGLDSSASFTEDSPAASVAPNADLSDVDSANLASATITLADHPDGAFESLSATTTGTSIIGSYDSGTEVLTLSGSDTVAHYQQVVRTLNYDNTSDVPDTTSRVVNVRVSDGSHDSNEPHVLVAVTAHNDAPSATDQSVSTDEDTAKAITLSGTDPENDALSFTYDSISANGGTITGVAPNVTYTPAGGYCGPDSFQFTVDDGNGGTDQGTVSVNVTCA